MGTYVSLLNNCEYCLEHHFSGLKRLLSDDEKSAAFRHAMETGDLESTFYGRELALLHYARKLTLQPAQMVESDLEPLRAADLDDGEILEANQIIGYFNYANRLLNGLGVTTDGDTVGYYAKD